MNPPLSGVSVVIPVYNEIARFPKKLKKILQFVEKNSRIGEVIFVDDGSTDATAKYIAAVIQSNPRCTLISYKKNKGKGYALRKGFAAASGDSVVFMDADISVPLEEIDTLVALGQKYDVVIGSRKKGITPQYDSATKKRARLSTLGTTLRKKVLLSDIADTQCGFKLFSRPIITKILHHATINGYGCDMEFLAIAKSHHATMYEVAVPWKHGTGGSLHTIAALCKALCSISFAILHVAVRAKTGFYRR